MQLPTHIVYERSTQEIQDMVDAFITTRNIPVNLMELMLYKVLSNVQSRKAYDYANFDIQKEQEKESRKEDAKEGEST